MSESSLTHASWWAVPLLWGGFLLRVVGIRSRPLWYDEAFAILYARLPPTLMVGGTTAPANGVGAADVHPLLYYFSLHGWMKLVGSSPFSTRFLSVVLGMMTVALLWRLACWCFGPRTGLAVAVLAAANPFHVAYSQETRMYALLGLTSVASAWSFFRALDSCDRTTAPGLYRSGTPRELLMGTIVADRRVSTPWKWWALYAVASALTLYAHNLGVFFLSGLHVLFALRRRWWPQLWNLLLANLGALALFSPWVIGVLPGQIGLVRRGYWLTAPGAEEVARSLMLPVLTFYEPAPLWLVGLGLFAGLLVLAFLVLQAARGVSRVTSFLVVTFAPMVLLLVVAQWVPVYLERALLPSALLYLVAVGWLLTPGQGRPMQRWTLSILLGLSTVASLANHYTYAGFPRPPFGEAAAYVRAHLDSGDAVVHTDKLTYFPMRYYAPDLPAAFLADEPGAPDDTLARPTQEALGLQASPTISDAIGSASSVWLVSFERELQEIRSSNQSGQPMSWFERDWVLNQEQGFAGLLMRHYEKRAP